MYQPANRKVLNLHVSADEHDHVKRMAQRRAVTMTGVIRRMIQRDMLRAAKDEGTGTAHRAVQALAGKQPVAREWHPGFPLVVTPHPAVIDQIDRLLDTGLWGRTRDDVAENLITWALRQHTGNQ